MNNVKAIILGAGKGVRMNSEIPKVAHKILDKTMLNYSIDAANEAGASEVCVIVGHGADFVKKTVVKDVTFALQTEQLGTGHAVKQALDFIPDEGAVFILYGDTPLVSAETLKKLLQYHEKEKNSVSVVSTIVNDPTGYGRIVRNDAGKFKSIVEHKDANEIQRAIQEINTGIYCFNAIDLKESLNLLKNNNAQGEYYLTDTLEIILNSGRNVDAIAFDDEIEFFGVSSKKDLAKATEYMRDRINLKHMINGVTFINPTATYVSADAEIGRDTIIYPNVFIEGKTKIGESCVIGFNSRIVNMNISDKVEVESSFCYNSEIGAETKVGPFAYIRPNSKIGSHVKIGDFVEIKNATIGDHTKASHLTYIGDADIGQNINFGCGTVTVNYDGKNKFRTTIKDNAFIGCNTNLVSPVVVAENAYIAAGSTITEDVPENSLAIARARQVIKINWRSKKQ